MTLRIVRLVLVTVALLSAGCATSAHPLRGTWQPGGRASHLDESQRALLARMIAVTPTEDALSARERIDELDALGDAEVRALLRSSRRWLERVERSDVERVRAGSCDAIAEHFLVRSEAPSDDDTGEVIGDLTSQGEERASHGVPIPSLRSDAYLGLGMTWRRHEARDAECARVYRVLRALAITRAWLGANVDDVGVLEVFREGVERLRGSAIPLCESDDAGEITTAITRHFAELDPESWGEAVEAAPSCGVSTIAGPRALVRHTELLPAHHASARPASVAPGGASSDVIGDLTRSYSFELDASEAVRVDERAFVTEARVRGLLFLVYVARRGDEWRVVEVVYSGQIEIDSYRRG